MAAVYLLCRALLFLKSHPNVDAAASEIKRIEQMIFECDEDHKVKAMKGARATAHLPMNDIGENKVVEMVRAYENRELTAKELWLLVGDEFAIKEEKPEQPTPEPKGGDDSVMGKLRLNGDFCPGHDHIGGDDQKVLAGHRGTGRPMQGIPIVMFQGQKLEPLQLMANLGGVPLSYCIEPVNEALLRQMKVTQVTAGGHRVTLLIKWATGDVEFSIFPPQMPEYTPPMMSGTLKIPAHTTFDEQWFNNIVASVMAMMSNDLQKKYPLYRRPIGNTMVN